MLADKLIDLRKKQGWSQEELADKLNVSRQAVSKWESAQAIPDVDKIVALSEVFNVSTDYLLKDDGANHEEKSSEKKEEKSAQSARERITDAVSSLFWSIILVTYLVWSFLSGDWGITWVIWPVSAALFSLTALIIELKYRNKNKKLDK